MKIIGLQSNNIKRLKAVELSLDDKGGLIIISGKNAQGKSSILDSIWMALGGTKAIPDKPIREGEESADITLDIKGDKMSFLVKRTFTDKGTYLTITNEVGAKYSNPQEMLNHLIGNLTFDPLEFTRLSTKEQVSQLMDLTGLNFDAVDSEIKEMREQRTVVGRVAKSFVKIEDSELKSVSGLAAKPELSVADLSNQYQEASKQLDRYNLAQERIKQIDEQIKSLLAEKEEAMKLTRPEVDMAMLNAQINSADETNKNIREAKTRLANHNQFIEKQTEYNSLTNAITEKETEKTKALSEAKMPIDGLIWDEDGVKFNTIPFNQLSGAEQLKVSMAIAMSKNPHLRVILIKDGSLLDKDNLNVIESLAKEKDFQIWLERVDDTGEVGIYIEDGEVKKVNK